MKTRDLDRAEPRHNSVKSHHIKEHRHDPYKARKKLHEPAVCPQCGAVFLDGRWRWAKTPPQKADRELCPACHRSNDKYPAGELTLRGAFLAAHRDEIIKLVRHTEEAEKREHPLQRIMSIDETAGATLIATTDIHLPRRVGHAIVDAYKGDLETHYDEGGYFVRMAWTRDA